MASRKPAPLKPIKALTNPEKARRASFYVLAVILGGLITIGLYNLGRAIGPRHVDALSIPFGLAEGTSITVGDDDEKELRKLPTSTIQDLGHADELLRGGKWREASEVYGSIAIQVPDLLPALVGKGRALLSADTLNAEALTQLDALFLQLDRKHPDAPETQMLRGILANRQGQSTVALEFLEQAVRRKGGLLEARYNLGEVLLKGGQPLGAESEARTGISLTQGSQGRFYSLLARAYHDAGQLDSCGPVVEFGLTRFPAETDLMVMAGMLAEYRGNFETAERNYRKALALDPEDSRAQAALHTLGEKSPPGSQGGKGMLTPRDKAQLAIDILQPLAQQYPENTPIHYALGMAYLKGRSFDQAREQFKAVQDKDPEYPDIQLRIQEASAVEAPPSKDAAMLTAELQRGVDSLRQAKANSKDRSFSERLGHYLVRWGASPKEFFARYGMETFHQLDSMTWQETLFEPPLMFEQTVVFRKEHGLSEVQVLVRDTSIHEGRRGVAYDLYGRLLGQNTRITGNGTSTGDTQCDTLSFQGAVWENTDNFEVMAQFTKAKHEVRMIRLDRSQFETMPRLCSYMQRLLQQH